jgi:hypothetical protein
MSSQAGPSLQQCPHGHGYGGTVLAPSAGQGRYLVPQPGVQNCGTDTGRKKKIPANLRFRHKDGRQRVAEAVLCCAHLEIHHQHTAVEISGGTSRARWPLARDHESVH